MAAVALVCATEYMLSKINHVGVTNVEDLTPGFYTFSSVLSGTQTHVLLIWIRHSKISSYNG